MKTLENQNITLKTPFNQTKSFIFFSVLTAFSLLFSSCSNVITSSSQEDLGGYVLLSAPNSEGGDYSKNLSYYENYATGEIAVSNGYCADSSIVIPSSYNGKPVTAVLGPKNTYSARKNAAPDLTGASSVGDSAFANRLDITSVTFPDTIASIGSQAFANTGLTSVAIPTLVNEIKASTFANCRSLATVAFASTTNLTAIGDDAFHGDRVLETCDFPSGLVSVGTAAFQDCVLLTDLYFWAGFESLGSYAFANCIAAKGIIFPASIASVGDYAFYGVNSSLNGGGGLFSLAKGNLPAALQSDGRWNNIGGSSYVKFDYETGDLANESDYLFTSNGTDSYIYKYNPKTTTGKYDIAIPKTLGGGIVRGIKKESFLSHSELTGVKIPSTVTFIDDKAFYGCNKINCIKGYDAAGEASAVSFESGKLDLTAVSSLSSIGNSAFNLSSSSGTDLISSIAIPKSCTKIGAEAFIQFYSCYSVVFEGADDGTSSLTSIGLRAFRYCGRRYKLSVDAVSGVNPAKSPRSLVLPSSLTNISGWAFQQARFIGTLTFMSKATSTDVLTISGDTAFGYCSYLHTINFPTNTLKMAAWMFENVSKWDKAMNSDYDQSWNRSYLSHVVIPSSCTNIGNYAFASCGSLAIYFEASSKLSGYGGAVSSYTGGGHTSESLLLQLFGDMSGTLTIPTYYDVYNPANSNTTGTRKLLLASDTGLDFDFLTDSLTSTDVTLTKFVYDPSKYANNTDNTITVPSSFVYNSTTYNVKKIGDMAFFQSAPATSANTSRINRVVIPDSITSIGACAFAECTDLAYLSTSSSDTSGTLPSALTSVGRNAFSYTKIAAFSFPSTIASFTADYSVNGGGSLANWYSCFIADKVSFTITIATGGAFLYSNGIIYKKSGTNSYAEAYLAPDSLLGGALTVAYNCTTVDSYALAAEKTYTSLTLPQSVTTVQANAAGSRNAAGSITSSYSCASVSFTNDNSGGSALTYGNSCFSSRSSLTSVQFPARLVTINDWAFSDCKNLVNMPTKSTGDTNASGYLNLGATNISTLGASAFRSCSKITKASIPGTVATVRSSAFYNCANLATLSLGEGLTTVGWGAFEACSSLSALTLPTTLSTISEKGFWKCKSLASVTIPTAVTTVGKTSFSACTSLAQVDFQASAVSSDNEVKVQADAFAGIPATSIVLPKGFKADIGGSTSTSIFTGSSLTSIFCLCTGANYDTKVTTNYAGSWNYTDVTKSPINTYFYAENASQMSSNYSNLQYWHYSGTTPTVWTPS